MDKKRVKESLLQALFIVIIQITYVKVFGRNNMLVGMIMAMGAVSFLIRDLTAALLYRTVTFLILNVILGILSYISIINIWTGILINFLTIFITTYIYMNDFRMPTSYIFLMSYIFMWAMPVSLNELPNRLLALSLSIFIIMLAQIIFNRNKFEKESSLIITDIVNDLQNHIDNIQNNEYDINKSIQINKKIRNLLTLINERSHRRFVHSKKENNQFNVAVFLDRLNLIINHIVKFKEDKSIKNNYLQDLKIQINNIKKFNEDTKDIDEINKDIDDFINKCEKIENKPIFMYESIHLLKIFKLNINNSEECKDKTLNKIYKTINIPSEFKLFNTMKENFNLNSLRFVYSIKLALAISLSMFLVQFFNIENGRWIVITIYVIMQPYKEDTVVKAKKRFMGTLIGVTLFFVIFSTIHDSIPKIIILIIAFLCYFYFKEYDKKVMSITIVSLSSVSLVHNINILSISRLIFIIIGILIALIINMYFFPYNISDSIDELKYKYKKNSKEILKELNKVLKGNGDLDKLIKLSLIVNQIESKLIANNNRIKDANIEKLIYEHSIKMSDARFLLLSLYNDK
ncbi:FUSC family protein [Romboutsia sp.]|uniref:FUSC family protein n=1 Tax=Romboutsia sp. TaxID=1965302 RepID=UPI002C5F57E1|nr:FUSC family protein [Romboutsia sp.]HSQ87780.1 FUSC family protein [Romboutsia sp.]